MCNNHVLSRITQSYGGIDSYWSKIWRYLVNNEDIYFKELEFLIGGSHRRIPLVLALREAWGRHSIRGADSSKTCSRNYRKRGPMNTFYISNSKKSHGVTLWIRPHYTHKRYCQTKSHHNTKFRFIFFPCSLLVAWIWHSRLSLLPFLKGSFLVHKSIDLMFLGRWCSLGKVADFSFFVWSFRGVCFVLASSFSNEILFYQKNKV